MQIQTIKNMTTNSFIYKHSAGSAIEVVEIERRFVVLQIPEIKDGWHAMYLVAGTIPIGAKKIAYEFTGKTICLETSGGYSRIRFELLQYDRALWLQFIEQIQQKQSHADTIFNSIKGES